MELQGWLYVHWLNLFLGEHNNLPLFAGERLTMLEQETMIPRFTNGDAGITELLDYVHEIEDLKALGSLAEWDQNTEMPEGAGEVRGFQSATLQGVLHERWTNQRLGTLLNRLNAVINRLDYTD